jgi:hypothetical protein
MFLPGDQGRSYPPGFYRLWTGPRQQSGRMPSQAGKRQKLRALAALLPSALNPKQNLMVTKISA